MVKILMTMKRDKAAGEKLGDGLAFGETPDHIAATVFEDEDTLQRGAIGQGETGVSMPRCAVHEDLRGIIAGPKFASRTFADDDAVVAEDFDFLERSPEASGRALPCSGVADEQIACAIWSDDADTVQLDGLFLGEAVHDEQFVEGVAEGISIGNLVEVLRAHQQACVTVMLIYEQSFVRLIGGNGVAKIELQLSAVYFTDFPGCAGIEEDVTAGIT